ncbi:MAG: hypothetical protein Q9202_007139, partial [Teloschistes flavicans]
MFNVEDTSEHKAASLEGLSPELQIQIMRQCDSFSDLHSLLRASPHLYQVFRHQKELILSHQVYKPFHPDIIDDAWILAKAAQIPQPPQKHRAWEFLNTPRHENALVKNQMPARMILPLSKLAATIQWFIQDYKTHSISYLAHFVTPLDLQQDEELLYSDLSEVEFGRIQRAFCRFETFRFLFMDSKNEEKRVACSAYAYQYLEVYCPDEVEEIACIRDYMIRRLWGVFDSLEIDAFNEPLDGPIRQIGHAFDGHYDWFTSPMKPLHLSFIEYMLSLGLPFLREVLQSDGLKRAELVISNSISRKHYITEALSNRQFDDDRHGVLLDFDGGLYDEKEGEFWGDSLDVVSQGLLWANRNRFPKDRARPQLKGLRDWGYIFWDKWRLEASGVLDK